MRCAPGLGPLARPVNAAAEGLTMSAEFRLLEVDLDRFLVHVCLDRSVLAIGLRQARLQASIFAALCFASRR